MGNESFWLTEFSRLQTFHNFPLESPAVPRHPHSCMFKPCHSLHSLCFLSLFLLLSSSLCAPSLKVLVTQSCPTPCNPMDCNPSGSFVHRILQAKILQWVAMPFSRDLPDPGIKPRSPALQAESLLSEPQGRWIDQDCCLGPLQIS